MTVFITIFSIVAIAELMNGAEFLEWNGQMARENAGTEAMTKQDARLEVQVMTPTTATTPEPVSAFQRQPASDGAPSNSRPRLVLKVKTRPVEIR